MAGERRHTTTDSPFFEVDTSQLVLVAESAARTGDLNELDAIINEMRHRKVLAGIRGDQEAASRYGGIEDSLRGTRSLVEERARAESSPQTREVTSEEARTKSYAELNFEELREVADTAFNSGDVEKLRELQGFALKRAEEYTNLAAAFETLGYELNCQKGRQVNGQ